LSGCLDRLCLEFGRRLGRRLGRRRLGLCSSLGAFCGLLVGFGALCSLLLECCPRLGSPWSLRLCAGVLLSRDLLSEFVRLRRFFRKFQRPLNCTVALARERRYGVALAQATKHICLEAWVRRVEFVNLGTEAQIGSLRVSLDLLELF